MEVTVYEENSVKDTRFYTIENVVLTLLPALCRITQNSIYIYIYIYIYNATKKEKYIYILFLLQLLQSDRLSLFAAAIRVCFLLFECMRSHLKFQLEVSATTVPCRQMAITASRSSLRLFFLKRAFYL